MVFGGFCDSVVLSTVEKFDFLSETWSTILYTLPLGLAKMGVISFRDNIIILGGVDKYFQMQNSVYVWDLNASEWNKLNEMLYPRTFNNSALYFKNYIYVIGGNKQCNCERYDLSKNKWEIFSSYTSVLETGRLNELYNFCFTICEE